MLDGEYGTGAGRVRIEGLSKTVRALERAGADSEDMKVLMHEIGMIIVRAANPPTLSGRLAGTIRAGRGKTKAVVRAGGPRAPYAGPIHFGWPAHNITPQPFLTAAIQSERGDLLQALDNGLGDILRKNELT